MKVGKLYTRKIGPEPVSTKIGYKPFTEIRCGETIVPLRFLFLEDDTFMQVLTEQGYVGWTTCVGYMWDEV